LSNKFLCDPRQIFFVTTAREECKTAMQLCDLNVQPVYQRVQFSLLVCEGKESAKLRDSLQLLFHQMNLMFEHRWEHVFAGHPRLQDTIRIYAECQHFRAFGSPSRTEELPLQPPH